MRPSCLPCSSRAAWSPPFSDRSPSSRRALISAAITGRFAMSSSSSIFSRSCASWDSQVPSRSVVDTMGSPPGGKVGNYQVTKAGVAPALPKPRAMCAGSRAPRRRTPGPWWRVGTGPRPSRRYRPEPAPTARRAASAGRGGDPGAARTGPAGTPVRRACWSRCVVLAEGCRTGAQEWSGSMMSGDARELGVGEQLRLMAVHAHPDDESSKGAATMAKYVAEGVDVLVATCTGGERGSVLNPKLDRPEIWENIAEIRRAEMERAREILGVSQSWLGFVDSGLPEGDPPPPLPEGCFALQDVDEAAERLVKEMREFRPHVVLTYDENGGYPHPDHIMTHKISLVAFDAAGDPERYPDAGEPWQPLKLYYHMWARARWFAIHEAMLAA